MTLNKKQAPTTGNKTQADKDMISNSRMSFRKLVVHIPILRVDKIYFLQTQHRQQEVIHQLSDNHRISQQWMTKHVGINYTGLNHMRINHRIIHHQHQALKIKDT